MDRKMRPLPWRVVFNRWRLAVIISVLVLSVTRALGYSPLGAGHIAIGPAVISGHGAYISLWVGGWIIVGVIAVVDLFTRRLDCITGLSFMMAAWGASYLIAWVLADFEEMGWMTTFTYWCPAVIIIASSKMVQLLDQRIGGLR